MFLLSRWMQLNPISKYSLVGVVTHLVLTATDGALILLPITDFYIFIWIMVYRKKNIAPVARLYSVRGLLR